MTKLQQYSGTFCGSRLVKMLNKICPCGIYNPHSGGEHHSANKRQWLTNSIVDYDDEDPPIRQVYPSGLDSPDSSNSAVSSDFDNNVATGL